MTISIHITTVKKYINYIIIIHIFWRRYCIDGNFEGEMFPGYITWKYNVWKLYKIFVYKCHVTHKLAMFYSTI